MTLSEAREKLAEWQAAETAVTKGQNYSIDGMSVTRVDADKIQKTIDRYNKLIKALERQAATGSTVGKATWT